VGENQTKENTIAPIKRKERKGKEKEDEGKT